MRAIVFILITVCLVVTNVCSGQPADKARIAHLQQKAFATFLSMPDSSIKLAHHTVVMARVAQDPLLEAHGYFILTKAYWVKANYRLSVEYGFKALKIVENTPNRKEWGLYLLAVGRTLIELGSYDRAGAYINRALALSREGNDALAQAEAIREYSYLMSQTGKADSALFYADRGITYFETIRDTINLSILYARKSRAFFDLHDFTSSRQYAYRSMELDTSAGNRRGLGVSYYLAARCEHAMGNNVAATRFLTRAIEINNALGNINYQIMSYDLMATIHLNNNQKEDAIYALQQVSKYKDRLYDAERNGQIQEMESLYELEGKDHTIRQLAQEKVSSQALVREQRLFTLFLLIAITLLFLLIMVLWRLRTLQQKTNENLSAKNEAIEQQKKEIQEQAESLHELNQLKTKLFSVISHDLRMPMANLQALLELLTNNRMSPSEFTTISDKLKVHLNASQRTLDNLLNWSLSQMEGIKIEQQNIQLKSQIDEACRLMTELAERKKISIETDLVDTLRVHADPNHVQLVLRNLLHNAIKFSNESDRVLISAIRKTDYCRISIRDFGMGMNQDEIDRITGSSEHFTKRGTQQEKGTGLGLLLCKEFIQRNEGEFSIQSSPGNGTEVSFTLALAD